MDVSVLDYGAYNDDTHEAETTAAFRNALNAIRPTGGTCLVPYGTYRIAPEGITGNESIPAITSDMHLVGEDLRPTPALHIHEEATGTIIPCKGSNWSIEKLRILMSGDYESVSWAAPINVLNAEPVSYGWKIDGCQIRNTGRIAIVGRGTHFTISNNIIFCTYTAGQGAHPVHQGIKVSNTGAAYPSYGTIQGNSLTGVGIDTVGHHHLIKYNVIRGAGYRAGIFSGGSVTSSNYSYSNSYIGNNISGCVEGLNDDTYPEEFKQVGSIEVWAPDSLFVQNNCHDSAGGEFSVGGQNSVVALNRVVNSGMETGNPSHVHVNGFNVRSLLLSSGAQHVNGGGSLFLGNVATDTRPQADKTQRYGISVETDWIGCVASIGNNFHGNELGDGFYRNTQPNVSALVGRDAFRNTLTINAREQVLSLLDPAKYTITDEEYIMLNQVMFGSSNPRP